MRAIRWELSIFLLALLIVGSVGAQTPAPNAAGKIYVADSGNSRIVRINDMTGAGWTTFPDTGISQLYFLRGIFVDAVGRIYVTDGVSRIGRMDDMTGAGWTTLGSLLGGSGVNQFSGPKGIFVDATGKIYVADTDNQRIGRINDMTGAGWTTFGDWGSVDWSSWVKDRKCPRQNSSHNLPAGMESSAGK
jgi:DNA-binding beta-propeller fold protein YncE